MDTILLSNLEYDHLYNEGGDSLVAFFATLRSRKGAHLITIKCKERLTGAITRISGLSRGTVKKYLPELVRIGLVKQEKGALLIRGRKWSNTNLPRLKNRKLIPIEVCDKFTDTKTSSFHVRIHSNLKSQEKESSKKAERIQLLEQHHRGQTKSLKDLKRSKRLIKKGHTLTSLKNSHRLNSTLANSTFLNIKNNVVDGSKGGGCYHKVKLLKRGLIQQQRNVHLFLEGVFSYAYLNDLRDSTTYGGFFIGKRGIYFEDSPTISVSCSSRLKKMST